MKKPSKYLLGQGAMAIGPMVVGETHMIPWRGHIWLECKTPGIKVMYKKHFRRPKTTRPLWWDETVEQMIDGKREEAKKAKAAAMKAAALDKNKKK